MSSSTMPNLSPKTLKHDINLLLTLFNRVDESHSGYITKPQLVQTLSLLDLDLAQYQ